MKMNLNILKNNQKYHWTNHVIQKMRYYGLSASRVIRLIRFPKRKQTGIAPKTIAVMQSAGLNKSKHEIWAMYAVEPRTKKRIIISAWKYPGVSKKGQEIPIPEEIREELADFFANK